MFWSLIRKSEAKGDILAFCGTAFGAAKLIVRKLQSAQITADSDIWTAVTVATQMSPIKARRI